MKRFGTRAHALVGASLLTKNVRTPRFIRQYALSLTFFASKLAPTKGKIGRLFVFEFGRALGDECCHAFLLILGGKGRVEHPAFKAHTFRQADLEGAKYILMERFAEDANLLEKLRNYLKQEATLSARVIAGKEEEGAKFRDYFEHDEPLKSMPSHRALAIFRGRNEGILSLQDSRRHCPLSKAVMI